MRKNDRCRNDRSRFHCIWKSQGISFSLGQLPHFDLFSCSPGHQKCELRKQIGHKNFVPYTFNFASQIGNSGMCCHHVASGSLRVINYSLMLSVCLEWSEFVNFDTTPKHLLGIYYMNIKVPLKSTFALSTAKCSECVSNLAQASFSVSDITLSPYNWSYCLSQLFQIVCKIQKSQYMQESVPFHGVSTR